MEESTNDVQTALLLGLAKARKQVETQRRHEAERREVIAAKCAAQMDWLRMIWQELRAANIRVGYWDGAQARGMPLNEPVLGFNHVALSHHWDAAPYSYGVDDNVRLYREMPSGKRTTYTDRKLLLEAMLRDIAEHEWHADA